MSTKNTFVFVTERCNEREAVARAALEFHGSGKWSVYTGDWARFDANVGIGEKEDGYYDDNLHGEFYISEAEHIALNDPDRVLADVAALRAVLDVHSPRVEEKKCNVLNGKPVKMYTKVTILCSGCVIDRDFQEYELLTDCETLRALASAYKDHPDYNPDWSL